MYTQIGRRCSKWLVGAALLLLVAPCVILSVALHSIYPMLAVLVPLALWVIIAILIYVPVFALKVICDKHNRSHKSNG